MNKRIFAYILIVLALIGCSTSINNVVKSQSEVEKSELEKVDFMDTDLFDKTLSNAMAKKADTIQVNMLSPASINKMPDRLNKWLTLVGEQGKLEVEPKTRSIVALIALAPIAVNFF